MSSSESFSICETRDKIVSGRFRLFPLSETGKDDVFASLNCYDFRAQLVNCEYRWKNETTLYFDHEEPFEYGTEYTVTIDGLQAQNGDTVEDAEFSFKTETVQQEKKTEVSGIRGIIAAVIFGLGMAFVFLDSKVR